MLNASNMAVIYARVSSKEQEKEGFSIPAQLKLLTGYAVQQGFTVTKEFVDVETAKQSGRTGFTEMLAYLRQHPTIRTLLVEKTDRLYRNLKDWVTLDEIDLEIHFAKENVVLSRDSRSSEKFMHGIKVLMAKNYIDNLSEETRKGMIEKAEQGIWPSCAPMGYKNVERDDGKKIIVQDDALAPMIKQMFDWYSTGRYSVKEVAKMSREAGMAYRKSDNPIPTSTVHNILRNRIYCGEFEWDGKLYQGYHQPIVDKDQWLYVQDLIDTKLGNRRQKNKHSFPFSGFIKCKHCGFSLIAEIKKGKYVYYRCGGNLKDVCHTAYTRQEVFENYYADALNGLRFDEQVIAWITTALKQSNDDKQKFHEEAITRVQTEYNRLTQRINAMYIDKLDGKISSDFFDTKSTEWKREQEKLTETIKSHQTANYAYMNDGIALIELAQSAHSLFTRQTAAEKRRLLDYIVSNSIWDGKKLEVEFKQPFDMIAESIATIKPEINAEGAEIIHFDKWLPGPDSNQRPFD